MTFSICQRCGDLIVGKLRRYCDDCERLRLDLPCRPFCVPIYCDLDSVNAIGETPCDSCRRVKIG